MAPAAMNLHSHAFQRAMAGLAEVRGTETDTFWTWRETMYRFALMMSPDDVEAVAAQLYVEMLEAGFAAVAEFHYLHHAPDGSPYDRARGNGRSHSLRGRARRHRHNIASGVLRPFDVRRRAALAGAAAVYQRSQRHSRVSSTIVARMIKENDGETIGIAPHSLRAVTPKRTRRTHVAGRRWSHSHPRRRTDQGSRGLRRLVRSSSGALAARPCRRRPEVVRHSCDPHGRRRDAGPRALGRGRRALSGDGSQSWRWNLQCRGLHPRRRALRRRHGLQCVDRRRRGIAPARICAEVTGASAQCLQLRRRRHAGGRCSRRSGSAAPRL